MDERGHEGARVPDEPIRAPDRKALWPVAGIVATLRSVLVDFELSLSEVMQRERYWRKRIVGWGYDEAATVILKESEKAAAAR
jgi:hypothetical protein